MLDNDMLKRSDKIYPYRQMRKPTRAALFLVCRLIKTLLVWPCWVRKWQRDPTPAEEVIREVEVMRKRGEVKNSWHLGQSNPVRLRRYQTSGLSLAARSDLSLRRPEEVTECLVEWVI